MNTYDDRLSSKNHAPGALEIAMRARNLERKQALMVFELRTDLAAENHDRKSRSRGLLASLLSSLKLF